MVVGCQPSLGAESTPGPWFGRKENMSLKIPVIPPGIDPGTVRLVAQRLNHYATPGPAFLDNRQKYSSDYVGAPKGKGKY